MALRILKLEHYFLEWTIISKGFEQNNFYKISFWGFWADWQKDIIFLQHPIKWSPRGRATQEFEVFWFVALIGSIVYIQSLTNFNGRIVLFSDYWLVLVVKCFYNYFLSISESTPWCSFPIWSLIPMISILFIGTDRSNKLYTYFEYLKK